MWGARYWGIRYWGTRYWGKTGSGSAVVALAGIEAAGSLGTLTVSAEAAVPLPSGGSAPTGRYIHQKPEPIAVRVSILGLESECSLGELRIPTMTADELFLMWDAQDIEDLTALGVL